MSVSLIFPLSVKSARQYDAPRVYGTEAVFLICIKVTSNNQPYT